MANFKVTQAKHPSETCQIKGFRAFSGERMGKGLKYDMLLYLDHLIRYWSQSVDFTNFDILGFWLNETFQMCGFRIWWRTHDSSGLKFGMPIYPDYPQNTLDFVTVCWYSSLLTLQQVPVSKASSWHYNDVIMSAMVSQITGTSIVYSTVCSSADQRKHQSSASLAFVRGIHQWLPRTRDQ